MQLDLKTRAVTQLKCAYSLMLKKHVALENSSLAIKWQLLTHAWIQDPYRYAGTEVKCKLTAAQRLLPRPDARALPQHHLVTTYQ